MKTGYGLELLQTQKLNLTPEMRQAITVLQMSALELRNYIISQAEENPLIEITQDGLEESLPDSANVDDDLLAYFCDSSDLGPDLSRNAERRKDNPVESSVWDKSVPLKDYLLAQLGVLPLSMDVLEAAKTIVGSIDDNGYLRCSIREISELFGHSAAVADEALEAVKSLDPPGVGAADLMECLALQAKSRGMDGLELRLVEHHLEDLAAGRYRKIAKEEQVNLSDVLSARDALLKLDPKPGSRFSDVFVSYVIPEIKIEKVDGEIQVTLNDRTVPRIGWNPFYRDLARMGEQDAKAYLSREIKKAQTLFRCVEQRKTTITRVVNAIIARQGSFFESGPGRLEPLTLKDISEEIGVHESTVSRAIANKYVDTPFGVFPCRFFFSPKVGAAERDLSQDVVKASIKEIVRLEDQRNPLGDQQICTELSRRGMRVARRTVSKYRSQLGIMPKNKRKGV